ncbi:MAG: class I SAM-dependent methyltransferase [Ferruginibacter sp.]
MKNSHPSWLYSRPRILNILHSFRLALPHSQMNKEEMDCLQKYAHGKKLAVEIGTYMGVSATIIATALASDGMLYCIDPFESIPGKLNPGFKMATRLFRRNNITRKIKFLRGYSNDKKIIEQIPDQLDFILIDGDHSYEGLENDWQIVRSKVMIGGIICLHDTTIPAKEPYRDFGSVKYFNEIIMHDKNFELLETAYSMNVIIKKGA